MLLDFVGGSYMLRSVAVDCQRTINLMPSIHELGNGKSKIFLERTPGLKKIVETKAVVRKLYLDSRGDWYSIEGTEFCKYTFDPTEDTPRRRVLGNITSETGLVDINDNGFDIGIVDGAGLYAYNYKDDTFSQLNPEAWQGSDSITYFSSYFVYIKKDTQQFYISKSYAINEMNALDFGAKENFPDNALTSVALNGLLIIVGSQSMQAYVNSGDAAFPLTAVTGGSTYVGCSAVGSISVMNDTMFFLGENKQGSGQIYTYNGGNTVSKISNLALDYFLQSQENLSDATAYNYQEDGKTFYVINFPDASTTWTFDLTTQMWHERQYMQTNGVATRHRVEHHINWRNKHIVSDYKKNIIYEMSLDYYNDDGFPIVRTRRSPHMFDSENLGRIFFNEFKLDCDVGNDNEDNAKIYLRYSNDGGRTWSNYLEANLGAKGHYKKVVAWRRLGSAIDRVWEVSTNADAKLTILNAYVT